MNPNTENETGEFIPFSRPSIGREEERAVLSVLRSGWLTTGKETEAFEKEFASFLGVPHAIAVNSATAGLHLSLEAAGVREGTSVVTPSYSFASAAETIRYCGADPLFVDIQSDTYNIDPALVERAVREHQGKISAILPVHIAGRACEMDRLTEIGIKYGIPVIEDAAHAFPVKYHDRYIGSFGTSGVFSFYANKTITTGEGGMIVTHDDALARRTRLMRLHGMDREMWDRYTGKKAAWYYEIVEAGYKYNMTDIAASIGRVQLKKAVSFLEKRRTIALKYLEKLAPYDFFILPSPSNAHAWHLFIIRIVEEKLSVDRDEFIRLLSDAGTGCSVHFIPLHLMPYYRARYGFGKEDFPVSYSNFRSSISIPIYPDLTEEQTDRIIATLIKTGKNACRPASFQMNAGLKGLP